MRNLNNSSRGVDSVTDVLSFPTLGGIKNEILLKENCGTSIDGRYIVIGSICLCKERIKYKRKTVGIITILKVNNYGAELQAFALQRKLQLMGYDSEIIDYLFYKNKL